MIYFNSQSIPELLGLGSSQRMQVLRTAADGLPTPTKITLNIIRLIILSTLFIMIVRAEGWMIVTYIVLLVVLYPLFTRPINFLYRSQLASIPRQQFPD